jgi:hypothetical protein
MRLSAKRCPSRRLRQICQKLLPPLSPKRDAFTARGALGGIFLKRLVESDTQEHSSANVCTRNRELREAKQLGGLDSIVVSATLRGLPLLRDVIQVLLASNTGFPDKKTEGPHITFWQVGPFYGVGVLVLDLRGIVTRFAPHEPVLHEIALF